MRILYGISGEGLGHTMRARIVVPHLVRLGHTVKVLASGRAARFLRTIHDDVTEIHGLFVRYRDGALERVETLAANAHGAHARLGANAAVALREVIPFRPDLVITDLDSFSYAVGRAIGCPVFSFDHHHVISRCAHAPELRRRVSYDFGLTEAFVRRKVPRCAKYIVSSFFEPPVRGECAANTLLVGPVVRPEVERATTRRGDHVLVYQTAEGTLDALHRVPEVPFVVYGLGARPPVRNVTFRPFDERAFIRDLASARAVVANGGHTTIAEALVLGKPVLACPIRHQGEQELNAAYLEASNLGLRARRLTSRSLEALLARPPPRPLASGTTRALAAIAAVTA